MWFIFPQLCGLGHSAMAQRYVIRDKDQALASFDPQWSLLDLRVPLFNLN